MAHLENRIEAAGAAFESLLYLSPNLIIDYQHMSSSRKHYHNRQSHCSEATDDSSDDSDLEESLFDSVESPEHEAYLRILDPRDWKVIHYLNLFYSSCFQIYLYLFYSNKTIIEYSACLN